MELYEFQFRAMGCPCELLFYADDFNIAKQASQRCIDEAIRFEHKYSRYRSDSVTTEINEQSGYSVVEIDAETHAVLSYAQVCYEQSEGLFDITSGVLRNVWNHDLKYLPSHESVERSLELVGWEKVQITQHTVYLSIQGMELDFGGVIKEYAADSLVMLARSMSINHGLVNLGGDICIIGPQIDNAPWPVGITHPAKAEAAIATIELMEGAITTSGGYERFIEVGGERFSHLVNPKTGWPVNNLMGVTVAAEKAVVAGSISTIALLQDEAIGLRWLEKCGAPYFAVDSQYHCHGFLARKKS